MMPVITLRNIAHISSAIVVAAIIALPAHAESSLRKNPTWNIQTTVEPDASVGGWYINLGVTGARGKIEVDTPTVIDVTYIFDNTPAHNRLRVGDQIVGANHKPFATPHKFGYGVEFFGYEGPMMDLGMALEQCANNTLTLTVHRDDTTVNVDIPLGDTHSAYAETFPFNCAKTDATLDALNAYLADKQNDNGHWNRGRVHIDAFAALALLSSRNPHYKQHTERAARAFAAATNDTIEYEGLDCWKFTLYGTYLAEYYLATRAEWVIPELEEINRWLIKAQIKDGGWGHRPALRPGGNGYGSFAAMTAQAMLAWSLMIKCGIDVDMERFNAAHEFLVRGTNSIGYLWYADDIGHPTHYADMGRTGTSAVAHHVAPTDNPIYRATALRHAHCIGNNPATYPDTHGSPLLGMAFTALGAAIDEDAFRKLLDANRWHFSLAECCDGTFYYQPNRDNNAQDYAAAPRLAASAATALILSIKDRNLAMTAPSESPE